MEEEKKKVEEAGKDGLLEFLEVKSVGGWS